ncbi:MAG: MBL fold metallo-hydrolase [Firmicutes bacterium]|jgi:metallo-beta-lactamase family protein|nr:MBL fold metallo-hydrolase [Bacillota bacterium]MDH7494462.1 MBL fold metallo-hydrolase [Bacillota bacterium]
MRLEFVGATRTVTGSCHYVQTGVTEFIVDCGMFQGDDEIQKLNRLPFPFDPSGLDFVLLTHAHIDHSGLIPRLVREGFKGKVYATAATIALCKIMLLDSAHIQELEAGWQQRKARRAGEVPFEPLYTLDDVERSISSFEAVPFGQIVGVAPDVAVRFRHAGHILGSAVIEVYLRHHGSGEGMARPSASGSPAAAGPESAMEPAPALTGGEVKIVFSGDLGNVNQPIIKDPEFVSDADFLIVESTYGNRVHEDRMESIERLRRVICDTWARGGNVIVPAFAVARTQDVLHDIAKLAYKQEVPPVRVFIDSPMAVSATEVFSSYRDEFDIETTALIEAGGDPFDFPGLQYVRTAEESRALNDITRGAIIISAGGMCNFGRIKHHLKHNLWRPECTVLFVGFQARGTLGRLLMDGAKKVRIFNEDVVVSASIESIDGYSAHADRDALLYWVRSLRSKPRRVFVVHGEEESAEALAVTLENTLGLWVGVPHRGDTVDLVSGETTVTPGVSTEGERALSLKAASEELDHAYAALRKALDQGGSLRDPAVFRASREEIARLVALMRSLAREDRTA